jgi:hypothetical protein
MAQPDRELGEFLRRSMRATADSVTVGEDGLDKIWTRLASSRQPAVADHRHIAVTVALTNSARASWPRDTGSASTVAPVVAEISGQQREPARLPGAFAACDVHAGSAQWVASAVGESHLCARAGLPPDI